MEPRIEIVGADLRPDMAVRLASQGVGLLWRDDFPAARRLLAAMSRRLASRPADFYRYRQSRRNRARVLGMLLVEIGPDLRIDLPRAPDVRAAVEEAHGRPGRTPLTELLGMLSAHEWRVKGVPVEALGARIHPHYGVFAPTRQDYVDLVAAAPLPDVRLAFDIGTGTGVLAAILARRGVPLVVATDISPAAVACARDNLRRLAPRAEVLETDLFPAGRADLLVCNPPWLPGSAHSSLDAAVFDPRSRMLTGFLAGAAEHLAEGGEAWLVLSDLAELLGLRTREDLLTRFAAAGLTVADRLDAPPRRVTGPRAEEVVSLWRLRR
ncbi:class I SAM-dependent methyltransferase [Amycolatopsis endophytica]|uniref:Methylase of polypeptide subunit release factors n=1 Tax=Amycolatopsis endophytica TaxID=860233 RepID=A0A853B171_9PSEU|nr:class I SAM-dependent methyltransferase [Amycolatopsis endophytica]NYI88584.1 methylase of polypeptide subunit release factors [Amycolatopsis endophytica]